MTYKRNWDLMYFVIFLDVITNLVWELNQKNQTETVQGAVFRRVGEPRSAFVRVFSGLSRWPCCHDEPRAHATSQSGRQPRCRPGAAPMKRLSAFVSHDSPVPLSREKQESHFQ